MWKLTILRCIHIYWILIISGHLQKLIFYWFFSLLCMSYFFIKLKYHDTGKEKDCLPQVGQWNMMNKVLLFHDKHFYLSTLHFKILHPFHWPIIKYHFLTQKMINGSTVNHWACINFSRNVQESTARGFCQELAQMCQVSGMVIFPHKFFSIFSRFSTFCN